MANNIFRGDAIAVAQVDSITPAVVEIGDIFKCTINGKVVSFTATAATVANVTAGLTAAWNASTITEFTEVTAADATTFMRLTADTAGKPFTVTATTTDGGGANTQTLTRAAVTACTGPSFWDNATNWSLGVAPVNTDDVYIENSSVDILYGLDQSAVTLTSLNISLSYTGKIGLPRITATGYYEYRSTYLTVKATTANIGTGTGSGSGRIKWNGSTAQTALNISGSGTPLESGVPSLLFLGTHASNTVTISKGNVGIAFFSGEAATVLTLKAGFQGNIQGDVTLVCGTGLTVTTVNQSGGTVTLNSAGTTLLKTDGVTTILSGAWTTLTLEGGTLYYIGTGTVTLLNISGTAAIDYSKDMRARTVTAADAYSKNVTINDPFKTVTWTAGIDFNFSSIAPGLNLGQNLRLTPAATA